MTDIEFAQFWTTATLGVNFQHGYRLLDNQRDSRFIGEFKQLGCHILVKKMNIKFGLFIEPNLCWVLSSWETFFGTFFLPQFGPFKNCWRWSCVLVEATYTHHSTDVIATTHTSRNTHQGTPITKYPSWITHHGTPITECSSQNTHHRMPITKHPSRNANHGTPFTERPSQKTLHGTAITERPSRNAHHGTPITITERPSWNPQH